MRGPIAWVHRIREALQEKEQAERFAERIVARMAEQERRARMSSGVALCPVCQHGEIGLVFGAMDDRDSN